MQARGILTPRLLCGGSPTRNRMNCECLSIDAGERHKVAKVEITGTQLSPVSKTCAPMQVQEAVFCFRMDDIVRPCCGPDTRGMQNQYHANGYSQVKIDSDAKDDIAGARTWSWS